MRFKRTTLFAMLAIALILAALFGIAFMNRIAGDDVKAAELSVATISPVPATSNIPECQPNSHSQIDKDICNPATPDIERDRLIAYRTHFWNNPALNCPDGSNNGLTRLSKFDDFTPCPNGALYLVVDHGKIKVLQKTGPVVIVQSVDPSKTNTGKVKNGWVIQQDISPTNKDNGRRYTRLDYAHSGNIAPFVDYALYDSQGSQWLTSINTNDHRLYTNRTYHLVFTWTDPKKPNSPAPLPFDRKCAPSWIYGSWHC